MAHICACGGELARLHRTFRQKLTCMAVYRCRNCHEVNVKPRPFMFYFRPGHGCPLCGTHKLRRLAAPDHIDPMRWNLYCLLRGVVDVQLFHCRYCRIQFYDRPEEASLQSKPG